MLFNAKSRFAESDLPSVLRACMEGNARAHRCLVSQFAGYARSVCLRYAAGAEEAEEIIQDGFLKVFTHLPRYDGDQPFKAWLRAIMVNTAVDYYRKNKKWANQISLDEVDIPDWSDDIIGAISTQEILALVQKLPPAYRIVFTLFVVDGYSHREIADLLSIQEGTSKSNLRDARKKLQLMIKLYHPQLYHTYNWPNSGRHEN